MSRADLIARGIIRPAVGPTRSPRLGDPSTQGALDAPTLRLDPREREKFETAAKAGREVAGPPMLPKAWRDG